MGALTTGRRAAGAASLLLAAACADELPVAPSPTVALSASDAWPDTLTMRDTVPITVRLVDGSGRALRLRDVRWTSSDERVLTVLPDAPPAAGTRADSLGAPLSARLVAHGHGSATITVTAEQAGVGSATLASETPITVLARWSAVSAGGTMTCAISVDADAYCWGTGASGLGVGLTTAGVALRPTRVAGGLAFAQVSVGHEHACGVTVDRLLYCWGDNDLGAIGDGTFIDRYVPTFVALGREALEVSVGNSATCVVTPSAQAFRAQNTFCWGHRDLHGRPDLGAVACGSPTLAGFFDGPCFGRPVGAVQGGEFDASEDRMPLRGVSVGAGLACALHEAEGTVWCWGRNNFGQAGAPPFGVQTYAMLVRGELAGTLRALDVSAAAFHACAIALDGRAHCWGDNFRGQLGSGAPLDEGSHQFTPVETALRFTAISAAGGHSSDLVAYTCALDGEGTIHCWGDNRFGQLGRTTGDLARPAPVAAPAGGPVRWLAVTTAVAANVSRSSAGNDLPSAHSCGLAEGGVILCWGRGQEGQLGTGARTTTAVPTRIAEP